MENVNHHKTKPFDNPNRSSKQWKPTKTINPMVDSLSGRQVGPSLFGTPTWISFAKENVESHQSQFKHVNDMYFFLQLISRSFHVFWFHTTAVDDHVSKTCYQMHGFFPFFFVVLKSRRLVESSGMFLLYNSFFFHHFTSSGFMFTACCLFYSSQVSFNSDWLPFQHPYKKKRSICIILSYIWVSFDGQANKIKLTQSYRELHICSYDVTLVVSLGLKIQIISFSLTNHINGSGSTTTVHLFYTVRSSPTFLQHVGVADSPRKKSSLRKYFSMLSQLHEKAFPIELREGQSMELVL